MLNRLNKIMRRVLRPVRARLVPAWDATRNSLGLVDSEKTLIEDARDYWKNPSTDEQQLNSHWRGAGWYADDQRWLALGRAHVEMFERFARALEIPRPVERVVEWGCGGGANAVHFAPLAREYVGVDIAQASLDECAKQMETIGANNFRAVLADAEQPERAAERLAGTCDLFLCTYVFELLPSVEYARRVLRIAGNVLKPGAMAMIQIKYRTTDAKTASRRFAYRRNLANNTSFAIDEFWLEAEAAGLSPRLVTLLPKDPLACDERYAYFACLRCESNSAPV